jgi:hypothetical protein
MVALAQINFAHARIGRDFGRGTLGENRAAHQHDDMGGEAKHDMHVVFRFASHIIVLVGGAIFAQGSPAEISADQGVREVYLGKRHHG